MTTYQEKLDSLADQREERQHLLGDYGLDDIIEWLKINGVDRPYEIRPFLESTQDNPNIIPLPEE